MLGEKNTEFGNQNKRVRQILIPSKCYICHGFSCEATCGSGQRAMKKDLSLRVLSNKKPIMIS